MVLFLFLTLSLYLLERFLFPLSPPHLYYFSLYLRSWCLWYGWQYFSFESLPLFLLFFLFLSQVILVSIWMHWIVWIFYVTFIIGLYWDDCFFRVDFHILTYHFIVLYWLFCTHTLLCNHTSWNHKVCVIFYPCIFMWCVCDMSISKFKWHSLNRFHLLDMSWQVHSMYPWYFLYLVMAGRHIGPTLNVINGFYFLLTCLV